MKLKTLQLLLVAIVALLLTLPSLVSAKPKGKVVFAQRGQNFAGAIGGDHSTIKWLQPWVHALHEPMLIKNLKAEVTPGLAESWTVEDGGLTITLKLRQGPTFHDGSPITADDVKFSIERYANDKYRMVFYKEL